MFLSKQRERVEYYFRGELGAGSNKYLEAGGNWSPIVRPGRASRKPTEQLLLFCSFKLPPWVKSFARSRDPKKMKLFNDRLSWASMTTAKYTYAACLQIFFSIRTYAKISFFKSTNLKSVQMTCSKEDSLPNFIQIEIVGVARCFQTHQRHWRAVFQQERDAPPAMTAHYSNDVYHHHRLCHTRDFAAAH